MDPVSAGEGIAQALRCVQEPAAGMNVVELGLVYEVWLGEAGAVHVNMTSPRPDHPLSVYLADRVREALEQLPGVHQVDVSILTEPRWRPEMMSEEARLRFGEENHKFF